jgi:HD-like signal output (HDOD) protein/CheY-like chemotaxis protein
MKRILFVDDEAALLEGLRRMLRPQRARWDMMFAGGGESALRMMESCPFDVVVTDMRMPGMDGAQLLERVRERFPGVVRIVLSGFCDMESALRAVPVAHQFLQKPCDPAMLLQSIERACSLSNSLQDQTVRRIVGAVGELPCLPRTAANLMRALDDPDVPVTQVGLIVEQDVAISAKVMQLVNSAFFGRSQVVTNIPHAVTFLGVDVLKQLVVTAEIFRAFQPRRQIEGFSLESIQSHSHLVAAIAAQLPLSKAAVSTATIAALLHDAGKLVMASRLPLECERVRRLTIGGHLSFPEAEEQVLGASHAEIGAYLLGLWGLPAGIVSAVARHHSPGVQEGDQPAFGAPAAVYFANLLTYELNPAAAGASFGELPPDDQAYLQAVGMEAEIAAWRAIAETAAEP